MLVTVTTKLRGLITTVEEWFWKRYFDGHAKLMNERDDLRTQVAYLKDEVGQLARYKIELVQCKIDNARKDKVIRVMSRRSTPTSSPQESE